MVGVDWWLHRERSECQWLVRAAAGGPVVFPTITMSPDFYDDDRKRTVVGR